MELVNLLYGHTRVIDPVGFSFNETTLASGLDSGTMLL